MENSAPSPCSNNPRETLALLIEQIIKLTPEQQRRLTDIGFGMQLQKEAAQREGGDNLAS